MEKQKWTEKPVTWGAYAKLCAISFALGTVSGGLYCVEMVEPAWWVRIKKFIGATVKRIIR